jgi:hypothetical protein
MRGAPIQGLSRPYSERAYAAEISGLTKAPKRVLRAFGVIRESLGSMKSYVYQA